MWIYDKYMKLFFYTLKDIGIERLFKRIIYKINNFIDELIFNKLKIDLFINLTYRLYSISIISTNYIK